MSTRYASFRTLSLTIAICLGSTSTVSAAESKTEKDPAPKDTAPAVKRTLPEQIQAIRQRLTDIREAALKANPKLKKKQRKLEAMVEKTIRADGYKPEKDEKRLKELKAAMKTGEYDHKRHIVLSDEYRETSLRLATAREEAMQDEKVVKTRNSLREEILAAMRKQDPKTDELIAELERLNAEARKRIAPRRR